MFQNLKRKFFPEAEYSKLQSDDTFGGGAASGSSKDIEKVSTFPTPSLYTESKSKPIKTSDILARSCFINDLVQVKIIMSNEGELLNGKDLIRAVYNAICTRTYNSLDSSDRIFELLCTVLRQRGENDIKNIGGGFLLHYAAGHDRCKIVESLIKDGISVNSIETTTGGIPLHYACDASFISEDVINVLVANGSNLNAKNNDGDTPAHCAIRSGYNKIYNNILKKGTNTKLKNKAGISVNKSYLQSKSGIL